MAEWGIKVSKPGVDVKTAATKDMVLTSIANQWKIHLKGSVTFTSPSQTVNVTHSLGYTPAFMSLYHSVFWDADRYGLPTMSQVVANDTNLKLLGNDIGDVISYVIFKDFGK